MSSRQQETSTSSSVVYAASTLALMRVGLKQMNERYDPHYSRKE